MEFIVWLLIGLIVGAGVALFLARERLSGWLMVNNQDKDEPPYLFLELSEPVETVCKKPYIRLKVNKEKYDSRD